MAPAAARRFPIAGGVVFRDDASGKVWLLRGELAEACRVLGDGEVVAALAEAGSDHPAPTEGAGERWSAPEHAPPLDTALRGDGVAVRIRVWDARIAAVLERMLAPLATTDRPASTLDLLVRDGRSTCVVDGRISQDALGHGWWVLVRQIARSLNPGREWMSVLHAATVLGEGGAAVLAGVSGSGKTTLAGALLARGARLVSDDASPIEAGSRLVWPCPLAMGVKQGAWPLFSRFFEDFDPAGAVTYGGRTIQYHPVPAAGWERGYPVAALVFPTWEAGAAFEAGRLDPADALSLLAASGMMPPATEEEVADLLDWLGAVPAWRIRHGDTEAAADFIHRVLLAPPGAAR